MIYLSDEQMNIVRRSSDVRARWSPVELPTGRQQLPAWAKGLHVDLMLQYGNSPHMRLKADRSLRSWEGKTFHKEGDRYMAVADDGRAEVYYQGGGLSLAKLKRYRTADGVLHAHPPVEPERRDHVHPDGYRWNGHKRVPGEWVEVDRLCTRQEQGFGGSHIDLVLDDGREVTLRGPWHGACPEGFVEVAYVDVSEAPAGFWRNKPWHVRGGVGGLFLRESTMLAIMATYQPHVLAAHVDLGGGPRLEPYIAEWGEPKAFWQARMHAAEQQRQFDATPIEQRPPSPRCMAYQWCGGKSKCQTGHKCPTHQQEKPHATDQ